MALIKHTKRVGELKAEHDEASQDLEAARVAGLASGEISGSNADLRKASAMEVLADKYEWEELSGKRLFEAEVVLEMAKIQERWLGTDLRYRGL
jgi:hypothetical protein